jgi:hypothetical protein
MKGALIATVSTDVASLDIIGVGIEHKGNSIHLVLADPSDYHTFGEVKKILGAAPADILVIDGQGTYEDTKNDFEMYQTLVRPGGKIAIGNISHPPTFRYWEEIPYPDKTYHGEGAGFGIVGL